MLMLLFLLTLPIKVFDDISNYKKYQTFDQNVYKLPKFSTLQMYQYRVSVFVEEISVFLLQTNLALNDGLLVDMNKWLMQTKMPSIIWLSSLISVTFSTNSQLQQWLGLFQILLFLSKCIVLDNNIEHFKKFEFLICYYKKTSIQKSSSLVNMYM